MKTELTRAGRRQAGRQDMRNSLGNWMPQGQFKLYVPESKTEAGREREREEERDRQRCGRRAKTILAVAENAKNYILPLFADKR